MIARRQFIHSFWSALAVLALPSASRALPSAHSTPLQLERRHDEFRTTSEEVFTPDKQIKVIGVGGAGGKIVKYMMACGVQGVEFICADTHQYAPANSHAHKTIDLGPCGPWKSRMLGLSIELATEREDEIRAAIKDADMLFITAGMGSAVGTGAAPVIARIAKDMGILTVGMMTMPFEYETSPRRSNAEAGLNELRNHVDSLIVMHNEKLMDMNGEELTEAEAFAFINDRLKNTIGGIVDLINASVVNTDFLDVCTVMGKSGRVAAGTALASGPARARIAANQALACPLMDGIALSDAKGVLVLIAASESSLKLSESSLVMNIVSAHASPYAHVIYGMNYDESLSDEIRVTVVATGLSSSRGSGAS